MTAWILRAAVQVFLSNCRRCSRAFFSAASGTDPTFSRRRDGPPALPSRDSRRSGGRDARRRSCSSAPGSSWASIDRRMTRACRRRARGFRSPRRQTSRSFRPGTSDVTTAYPGLTLGAQGRSSDHDPPLVVLNRGRQPFRCARRGAIHQHRHRPSPKDRIGVGLVDRLALAGPHPPDRTVIEQAVGQQNEPCGPNWPGAPASRERSP